MPEGGRRRTDAGCAPACCTGPTTRCASRKRGDSASPSSDSRAIIDLRQKAQYDRGYAFGDEDITHHIPTVDRVIDVENPPRFEQTADIVELYEDMVVRGGPQIVRAVDTVAEYIADGPVLVHCVAGKDRTGLVVALVQAALGCRVNRSSPSTRCPTNPRSDGARR